MSLPASLHFIGNKCAPTKHQESHICAQSFRAFVGKYCCLQVREDGRIRKECRPETATLHQNSDDRCKSDIVGKDLAAVGLKASAGRLRVSLKRRNRKVWTAQVMPKSSPPCRASPLRCLATYWDRPVPEARNPDHGGTKSRVPACAGAAGTSSRSPAIGDLKPKRSPGKAPLVAGPPPRRSADSAGAGESKPGSIGCVQGQLSHKSKPKPHYQEALGLPRKGRSLALLPRFSRAWAGYAVAQGTWKCMAVVLLRQYFLLM